MSRARVMLVVAATSTTGGGERHVADLLRSVPRDAFDIGLVCPAGGELPALAGMLGVPHYAAGIGGGFSRAGTRQLRAALAAFQPDVVHAHGSRAAFYARRADPRAAERCAYTLHGIHIDKAGNPLRRAVLLGVERRLVPRTALFVTVCRSDSQKGTALGVLDPAKTATVYNGISMPTKVPPRGGFRAELGLQPDVPLVLSVGRLHEQKDQVTLLRAWAQVRARVPSAVLALVGSGPLEADLRALARHIKLGDSLRFVPPRPGLASAYVDADVFCLSSLWEGLPYVLLEAMAFGLSVASTSVDGVPEVVEDGVTGVLVPPADPGALAAAVTRLLADPEAARAMGEAGRVCVEQVFTVKRMVEETLALYSGLLRERGES